MEVLLDAVGIVVVLLVNAKHDCALHRMSQPACEIVVTVVPAIPLNVLDLVAPVREELPAQLVPGFLLLHDSKGMLKAEKPELLEQQPLPVNAMLGNHGRGVARGGLAADGVVVQHAVSAACAVNCLAVQPQGARPQREDSRDNPKNAGDPPPRFQPVQYSPSCVWRSNAAA